MPSSVHQPRIAVSEAAILRREGMADIACTIVDVSADGFRLSVPRGVPCGTNYNLHFARADHRVAIRWASVSEAGGMFLEERQTA